MKKGFVLGIFVVLILSLVALAHASEIKASVNASLEDSENESGDDNGQDSNETEIENESSDDFDNNRSGMMGEFRGQRGELRAEFRDNMMRLKLEFKDRLREHNGTLKIEGRNITVRELSDEQKEIIIGRINAKTGLNLTIEDIGNGSVGEIMRAYMSNGAYAQIKIMPDRASEIALKRLEAKCEERNCTVELKEFRDNRTNKTRVAYEVQTEKGSRFLFLFKGHMKVNAVVDAETGEIVSYHKPWWAFLAKEDNTSDNEIEEELNVSSNSSVNSS